MLAVAGVSQDKSPDADGIDLLVTYETGPTEFAYMNKRDEPGSHSFPSGH